MKVYLVWNTGDAEERPYRKWIDSAWLKRADANKRLKQIRIDNGTMWHSACIELVKAK